MKATKLPSGNWRVQVLLGMDANGKRIRKSFSGINRKEVEAEAHHYLVTHSDAVKDDSFGVAAERFLLDRESVLSPSTMRSYRIIAKRLESRFGAFWESNIGTLRQADLQKVVDRLVRSELSPKTISNYYGFISAVLDYSGAKIPHPRLPQKRRPDLNVPDSDTVKAVLDAVKGTDIECPVMLAAFGPMRRGEICALKWSDIKGNVIHVQRDCVLSPEKEWVYKLPKTLTSDRHITMPDFVIEKLNEIKHQEDSDYIFSINPNQITDKFRRALKAADIPDFRFHDLRHFCCSYLHGMNVPDIYIMQRSGHATISTLRQIYTHTLQDQSESETKRILGGFNDMLEDS